MYPSSQAGVVGFATVPLADLLHKAGEWAESNYTIIATDFASRYRNYPPQFEDGYMTGSRPKHCMYHEQRVAEITQNMISLDQRPATIPVGDFIGWHWNRSFWKYFVRTES